MTFRLAWRGVFSLLIVLVTYETLTPDIDKTKSGLAIARFIAEALFQNTRYADKVAHFLAYAALAGSATFAAIRIGGKRWAVILALAVYGVALEILQGVGGVRVGDLADAAANTSGAAFAFFAALAFENMVQRTRPV